MRESLDISTVRIIDLKSGTQNNHADAARILHDSFKVNWPEAWPTLKDAQEEVQECLGEERICLAALDTSSSVIGWVGGIKTYDGRVYELHPICVEEQRRGLGIGALLVKELEKHVAAARGITIYLGTDDENNQTTLGGSDIYDDLWSQISNIRNLKGHPYSFYERLGYKIVGVVPDANGFGKPDIMMAKRVG